MFYLNQSVYLTVWGDEPEHTRHLGKEHTWCLVRTFESATSCLPGAEAGNFFVFSHYWGAWEIGRMVSQLRHDKA